MSAMRSCLMVMAGLLLIALSGCDRLGITVDPTWSRTYGGAYGDGGSSARQTSDGGYIVAATLGRDAYYASDAWLIKTNASGYMAWSKNLGGAYGYAAQQTTDGGYVVLGCTGSFGPDGFAAWLIKTDARGNKRWDKTFGGDSGGIGYGVQQTSDGGYVLTGSGNLGLWLIKADADGNKVWQKTLGSANGRAVQQTSDGGFIVVGDWVGIRLIKTDPDGNKVWNRSYGDRSQDRGNSVQQTSDGGYIVVGTKYSYGINRDDVWLIKTDADGNVVWDQTFERYYGDRGNSVQQTTDGGYVVAGDIGGVCLIKTDADGNEVWERDLGGYASCVQQTSDGGYMVVGTKDSDVWVAKTDSNGEVR